MPAIADLEVRNVVQGLQAARASNPSLGLSSRLDDLVAGIADRPGMDAARVKAQMQSSSMSFTDKVELAKAGLDAKERADLTTLMNDGGLRGLVDATATKLIHAILGTPAVDRQALEAAKAAVREFKELLDHNRLEQTYLAAIGESTPDAKKAALELFARLPKITTATSAKELEDYGLWTKAPRGIEAMQRSARYLPGRQVLVKTTVVSDAFAHDFLTYDPNGLEAITSRASLVGEEGDQFLVKVDGKTDPIRVSKQSIYQLNQPHAFSGDKLSFNGKSANYDDPLLKAKLVEAALRIAPHVAKIDFRKTEVIKKEGGLFSSVNRWFSRSEDVVDVQKECVKIIHNCVDMKYPGWEKYGRSYRENKGRISGSDAGRMAIRGTGSCGDQCGVMAALLVPFSHLIGVDVRMMSGGNYRKVKRGDKNPFNQYAHSWLGITYRPTMSMYVSDRTWRQPNKVVDRAYSRSGDRYPASAGRDTFPPSGRSYGPQLRALGDTDVNMSGKVTVATLERQFGQTGDGRENHQSNDYKGPTNG